MRTFKLYIEKDGTPTQNFKLWIDGKLKLNLTPTEVGSGVTKEVSCYRDGHFFSFPNCTHNLNAGFMGSSPVYTIMTQYPSRKWLSYIPHRDAAGYKVEVVSVVES